MAEDVAEIYFRAWRKASSSFLEEIESCIQELMQQAILLHRTSPVQPRVRQVCLSHTHPHTVLFSGLDWISKIVFFPSCFLFSRPRVMTSLPVLQILTYFHKQKFRQGVDQMLHRLYMPILWKALKVS